jgi:thiol:disulfide interchange protein
MQALIALIALGGLAVMGWLFLELQKQVNQQPPPAQAALAANAAYSDALARARQEGKPVLLIFTASWCGPCQQMKKEVYPSAPVQAVAGRFIWHTVDVDLPENQALASRHGVRSIPTLVIIDAKGQAKAKITGGRSPRDLAEWLAKHN